MRERIGPWGRGFIPQWRQPGLREWLGLPPEECQGQMLMSR